MMFLLGVLVMLQLTVTPLMAGRRSVNPCQPCRHVRVHPHRRPSTTQHLCRFTRDLSAVRSILVNSVRPFVYNQRITAEYSFCTEEDHVPVHVGDCQSHELMLDTYNTLTDMNSGLEALNHIRSRTQTRYTAAYLLTPLCDLWKALRNEGLEVPCALCDKSSVEPPSNTRHNLQTSTLYANATLHNSICTIGKVIQDFETIVDCRGSF